jgi:hypothetical protein
MEKQRKQRINEQAHAAAQGKECRQFSVTVLANYKTSFYTNLDPIIKKCFITYVSLQEGFMFFFFFFLFLLIA